MTTQQFMKGLMMALVTVIVAAFSQQPIDYLLLAVAAVSTILTYTGKNLLAVLHSDSPAGALSWVNLASGLLIAIGTGILASAGTYLLDGVILWTIVWKVVLSSAFTYLGTTFFAPQHSTAKVRVFVSPSVARSLMKVSAIVLLFFAIGIGASAQKKSVLDPVRVEDLKVDGAKAGYTNWFLRINTTLTANTIKLSFNELGEFNGFQSAFLSRVGIGPSFAHFVEKDGQAVNNYSVNALLLTPTDGITNLALAATFSMYNVNIGLGYDFIKDTPFKQNLFLMFGAQLTFY